MTEEITGEVYGIPYAIPVEVIEECLEKGIDVQKEVVQSIETAIREEVTLTESEYWLNTLADFVHARNVKAGWWTDLKTGEDLRGYKNPEEPKFSEANRDLLNLLCLVHSEVSEACEGVRKNLPDDKLPHRSMLAAELADTVIRILDIAGAHSLDIGTVLVEKLQFNATREDHKIENRVKEDGKKF